VSALPQGQWLAALVLLAVVIGVAVGYLLFNAF
jgi:multisubunit Na+/H+ antiporter MnhC subunit